MGCGQHDEKQRVESLAGVGFHGVAQGGGCLRELEDLVVVTPLEFHILALATAERHADTAVVPVEPDQDRIVWAGTGSICTPPPSQSTPQPIPSSDVQSPLA